MIKYSASDKPLSNCHPHALAVTDRALQKKNPKRKKKPKQTNQKKPTTKTPDRYVISLNIYVGLLNETTKTEVAY